MQAARTPDIDSLPSVDPALAAPPAVQARDVVKRFGQVTALAGVSLDIPTGGFVSILGPSGCGKTTLLRIVAGLESQDSGSITIAGIDVTKVPPHRRPVNLVFQRYALFPHLNVRDNIAYSLKLKRTKRDVIDRKVDEMLALIDLPEYGTRMIQQLSGGQAQRVALARALITAPPVLLLDEPLTALDLKLRQAMQLELREIHRRVGSTFIYVTHDQTEALLMSDTIVLMNDGEVVQQGAPRDVYDKPTALFSATFLGEANLFNVALESPTTARCEDILFSLATPAPATNLRGWLCLRPEQVRIAPSTDDQALSPNAARGSLTSAVFVGSALRYVVNVGPCDVQVEVQAERGVPAIAPGTDVTLSWTSTSPAFISQPASDPATP